MDWLIWYFCSINYNGKDNLHVCLTSFSVAAEMLFLPLSYHSLDGMMKSGCRFSQFNFILSRNQSLVFCLCLIEPHYRCIHFCVGIGLHFFPISWCMLIVCSRSYLASDFLFLECCMICCFCLFWMALLLNVEFVWNCQ